MNMGWILGYRKQYYDYDTDYVNRTEANTTTVRVILQKECLILKVVDIYFSG